MHHWWVSKLWWGVNLIILAAAVAFALRGVL